MVSALSDFQSVR